MGEVFRARDPRIGRDVAIKVLPKELAGDAERLRRFEQEARTAGTLNHPNLITIYDIGDERGAPFIVMELLDGETLRERLPATGRELENVLLRLAEVCDGVAAAHAAGVIHRDLKPENIIVTRSGYAKVLDFGLAKLAAAENVAPAGATAMMMTEPGMIVGTIDYMSPEQATGRRLDARSDIFALGSILFEALTGEVPFTGETIVDTLHRIVRDEPPPLSAYRNDVPAELQRIVGKCLAKDPNDRYQSAKQLATDLRAVARGSASIEASRPRRRWLLIAAAIALVVGLAAWIVATRTRGGGAPLRIEQITSSGNVIGAAVSPDGKYVATIVSEGGMQSLWLRQSGTTQSIALVPPALVSFWGVSFAPDGTTIDYVVKNAKGDWSGTVNRIHTLGGPSRVILTGADSGIAFSRDGKRMAWLRAGYPHAGESALMIANADGSGARALAVRKAPEIFAPIFWAMPAWSPDGSAIATPISNGNSSRLTLFDSRSGAATPVGPAWAFAGPPAWLPDGRSLLLVAGEGLPLDAQIWEIEVPAGTARRITHDLSSYRTINVTSDGRAAVAVAVAIDVWCNVWLHIPGRAPVKIAAERRDGFFGVTAGVDRIVYTASNDRNVELWTVMRDGSGRQPLVTGAGNRVFPRLTRDGRRVIYLDDGPRGVSIARVDIDGTNPVRLAPASADSTPTVSPDGRSVYFNADLGTGPTLYRVGIDGGNPVAVARFTVARPAISPDGRSIAGVVRTTPNEQPTIAIVDANSGMLVRRLASALRMTTFPEVHWSSDGRDVLFYRLSEIVRVPAAGGAVETVVSFDQTNVFRFDTAPDGALVIARGTLRRDAVQLAGFD